MNGTTQNFQFRGMDCGPGRETDGMRGICKFEICDKLPGERVVPSFIYAGLSLLWSQVGLVQTVLKLAFMRILLVYLYENESTSGSGDN